MTTALGKVRLAFPNNQKWSFVLHLAPLAEKFPKSNPTVGILDAG